MNPSPTHFGASLHLLRSLSTSIPSLYRGITPNLLGNTTSWALYFLFYNHVKNSLPHPLQPSSYLLASTVSGALTTLLTNPIWVLKTRFLATSRSAPGAYTSLAHGVRQILREKSGWRGFYRGLGVSMLGVALSVAAQWLRGHGPGKSTESMLARAAAIAGDSPPAVSSPTTPAASATPASAPHRDA